MNFYENITNIIARSIGFFAPGYAKKYMENQIVLRAYTAAKTTGIDRSLKSTQSSGAQENVDAWQTIADRARDLDRNNPYVVGMRKRFVASVVGEGSWPRPKIYKGSNKYDFDRELNNDILARWEAWSEKACANGDTFYQLQRIATRALFVDGCFLIRKVIRNKQLMLEGLECDYLDTGKDIDDGIKRIKGGIELDQYNKPVAYWLKRRFPSEKDTVSSRVPAEEILHIFDRTRASDVNGVCGFSSVVMNLYGVNEYRQATMNLARVATGFGVFVESPYPTDFMGAVQGTTDTGANMEYVNPGAIHYLRPGEKIGQVKPENPGNQYEGFVRSELRAASVGAGVSYESISNDGSQGSFSSTRQMLLFERAMARYIFALLEEQFYSRVYSWFIQHEIDFGKPSLKMPGFESNKRRYLACSWSRPKTEWVDPLKDTKSAAMEVAEGFNSVTSVVEVTGKDIEEIVAERKYEKQLFQEAGLQPSPSAGDTSPMPEEEINAEGLDKWLI